MMQYQIISDVADVHGLPDINAVRGKFETQLVFGETFTVSEENGEWCKGACDHDGYAGYIRKKHLSNNITTVTHIVAAARSHVYQGASIKSPHAGTLSFGSKLQIVEIQQGFARTANGVWIYQKDITPVETQDKDYVATALKFTGTPYYWGGRSGFGIDCSGLVQVCLARAGITAPRDTEQQQEAIGKAADKAQAGDFVFLPGHVGIMADDRILVHANAFHMKVIAEPLSDVTSRRLEITAVRRL